jgi:putative ABC transport system permease protein
MFRQARRNKIVSGINLIGLVLAISACLLISQFVLFEYSFEDFHPNADRTYRINLYNTQNGLYTGTSAATVPALGYNIKQSIPGVENITRVSSRFRGIVSNPNRKFEDREDNIVFGDPSVVDVLSLELIDGTKTDLLHDPRSVMISESTAKKYFGEVHAVGRTLEFGFSNNSLESTPYQIQGVFRDIPLNTHQRFDIVLPPDEKGWSENWAWSDVSTYVVLAPGIQPSSLDNGLAEIVKQHHHDNNGDKYLLEPLKEIRLRALSGTRRANLVNFFILLGGVILLLAWFNYTNLSTARFLERMKEVGVRKVIGASRFQLMTQFLTESFLYNCISFVLATVLFFLLWPPVTSFLNLNIPITLFSDPAIFFIMLAFVCISTLCSGLYPSIYLSSFKPISSLKGLIAGVADRSTLRKVVITVQLSVSIALVTAVIAIQRQIEFMRSQDLGIAIDQTLIIEEAMVTDPKSVEKYETVKNEILKLSSVKGITNATSFPGREIDWHRMDIYLGEENVGFRYDSRIVAIGSEFLNMFEVPLVAGRNFNSELESDKKAMLISEEASRMFGFKSFEDALGKIIFVGSRRFEVIGVTKDYHQRTLQSKIDPVLYMQNYPRGPAFAVKLTPDQLQETIPQLKTIWENGYPGNVFRYYFLDEFFERQYKAEIQIGTIVSVLTGLVIIIACSGLFALSIYAVGQRKKEISIRKIFGATVSSIIVLLSKHTLVLIMLGGLITIPLMYYGVSVWLDGYAYRMAMDGWMFVLPFISVLTLVTLTISFKTIAAARRNPVENMRHE